MKTLTETMSNYRDMVISEKWDEKMHTPKDEKGKWDDWSLADLKGELSKLKNNPKKSDALKKREKQVEFAIRSKQKNKWGKIKEAKTLKESAHPKMEAILNKYASDVDKFIEDGFYLPSTSKEFQYALYEYYVSDMPYGTAKARTGDPDEFVTEHFSKYLIDNGLVPDDEDTPTNFLSSPQIAPIPPDTLGESRTNRKCNGKGCDKKCVDGKNYCSKKCQSNTINLKKEVPIDKKLKENKFTPGPWTKAGAIQEGKAADKNKNCKSCKAELKGLDSKERALCSACWKKEKESFKKK